MLAVAEINYIRHEVNTKDRHYADVADSMNKDPRTVKKYADMDDFNEKKVRQKRPARVMDPIKSILESWILEDFKKKKKFRRTAQRMYDLLVQGYHFKGSARSVRLFVSQKKKELLNDSGQASLPLESKSGTAQVDFGEAPFKYQGKNLTLSYLVMSFPFSNSFYFQVLPSQNAECFLEGMKRIFHHMGGVPKTIRFDNLSPAVKKVLPEGKRLLTDGFQNFVFHYGFDYEFCNPASGNEKGHVEAMVKYIRNNFLLPELSIHSLNDFNLTVWNWAEDDRHRDHYEKKESIAKLYLADKDHFLQLPEKPYECVRYQQVKADKYGYVQIDSKQYSTSPRFAKSMVLAKIAFDTINLLTDQQESIVTHARIYGDEKRSMIWQPYLTLMAKRPQALKYTSFYEQLPDDWQQFLSDCTIQEKQSVLRLLSVLLKDQNLTLCTQALVIARRHGHPSAEDIKQIYYQLKNGRGNQESYQPKISIPSIPEVSRGLAHYDKLLEGQEGDPS
jgi:transposase